MKIKTEGIKAYLTVFRMRMKMEMQYRGAVLGGVFCQTFFGLLLIALYRALYAGNPQETTLESVVTYVWLQQAFFRMLLSSDDELSTDKIKSGSIAYDLCRPLDLYGFYYARIAALKMMGSLLRAAPMMLVAILLPRGWRISAPASLPAFFAALASLGMGLLCTCAMENIGVAFTMRTLDGRGIQAMMNLIAMFLTGNLLPLTLFPDAWQRVMTLLPHAQMLDVPIRLYTGQWALSVFPRALLIQTAWTAVLIWLGRCMWRKYEKRLIVQGG